MPTDKPRITFALDTDTLAAIDDYKFKHRAKNQSQAIISLIERGLASLEAKNENTPAPEGEEVKEVVSLDETNALLVDMGYIREGEQLSLADLVFLEHIGGLMDAWFSGKRS